MRNSNLTQLNSNGTRRKRGSNNGGGSIQRPSLPPIQRNRKIIVKGSTIPHGIEYFPVGPFAEISIHLKFILITSPNQCQSIVPVLYKTSPHMKPKLLKALRFCICCYQPIANTEASFQLDDHIADARSKISLVHKSA